MKLNLFYALLAISNSPLVSAHGKSKSEIDVTVTVPKGTTTSTVLKTTTTTTNRVVSFMPKLLICLTNRT